MSVYVKGIGQGKPLYKLCALSVDIYGRIILKFEFFGLYVIGYGHQIIYFREYMSILISKGKSTSNKGTFQDAVQTEAGDLKTKKEIALKIIDKATVDVVATSNAYIRYV
jgi:hypothetical protein